MRNGCKHSLCLFVGMVGVLLSTIGHAADNRPAVQFPLSLPKEAATISTPGTNEKYSVWAMVTAAGTEARVSPDGASPVRAKLNYKDSYRLVMDHQDPATKIRYALLAIMAPGNDDPRRGVVVGWIPWRHCLTFMVDSADKIKIRSIRDPETYIPLKCMFVRDIRGASREPIKQVPIRSGPSEASPVLGEDRLFRIYYVYSYDGDYCLIGRTPDIAGDFRDIRRPSGLNDGKGISDDDSTLYFGDLVGWVHNKSVISWKTREALEFNKHDLRQRDGDKPALVFRERQDLETFLNAQRTRRRAVLDDLTASGRVIGQEDMNNRERPRLDLPRYPILEGASPEDEIVEKGGQRLYRVGIVGDVVDDSGSVVATNEQIREQEIVAQRIYEDAKKVQIVFVIAATFNMEPHRKRVLETIANIFNELDTARRDRTSTIASVEVSLNFFRHRNDPKSLTHGRLLLNQADIDRFSAVNGLPAGGAPTPTQLYDAVAKSLDQLSLDNSSPHTSKFLVVISDNGDDGKGDVADPAKLCAIIKKHGGPNPFTLLSVAVGDNKDPRTVQLLDQLNEVKEQLVRDAVDFVARQLQAHNSKQTTNNKNAVIEAVPAFIQRNRDQIANNTAQVLVTLQPDEVARRILAIFEQKEREALAKLVYTRKLANASGGGNGTPPAIGKDPLGFIWQRQILEGFKTEGVTWIEEIQGRQQIFHEGWVAERHPDQLSPKGWNGPHPPACVSHLALLHQSELKSLYRKLSLFLDTKDDQLGSIWTAEMDLLAPGIKTEGVDLDTLNKMHTGIVAKQGLLGYTLAELQKMSPDELKKLRDRVNPVHASVEKVLFDRDQRWWEYGAETDPNKLKAWVEREVLP